MKKRSEMEKVLAETGMHSDSEVRVRLIDTECGIVWEVSYVVVRPVKGDWKYKTFRYPMKKEDEALAREHPEEVVSRWWK